MSAFPNVNPVTHLNSNGLVNPDSSGVGSFLFTNTRIPSGPHTLLPPGNNVQSAASIYPGSQKGGKVRKINRRKINKISRKYKMKGSRKSIKRRLKRRMRSHRRSRSRHNRSRRMRGGFIFGGSKYQMGGGFQAPMTAPNYPAGHSQYMNNNGSIPNTYSLGGQLSASSSSLATPPLMSKVANAAVPDNLNHNTLNSYGNIGAGSGFASRGWF
jgi:hypothetical protein